MAIPKIETVFKPQIGKYYLVPCIFLQSKDESELSNFDYYPIFGPMHDDKKFLKFDVDHYHYDTRFMYERELKKYEPSKKFRFDAAYHVKINGKFYFKSSLFGMVPKIDTQRNKNNDNANPHRYSTKVVYRKRKMLREFLQWPHIPSFHGKLKSFHGTKLKEGHICPHKGADLSQVKPNKFGIIVCPLHGLGFKDGVCVDRGRCWGQEEAAKNLSDALK